MSGDVGYDPVSDFAAIAQLTSSPNVLAVHTSIAAATVKELVALATDGPEGGMKRK